MEFDKVKRQDEYSDMPQLRTFQALEETGEDGAAVWVHFEAFCKMNLEQPCWIQALEPQELWLA